MGCVDMQILMAAMLCIMCISGPLLASDMEAVELLSSEKIVRDEPVYIQIEAPPSRNPLKALSDSMQAVPKDVWRIFVSMLAVKEQLNLRSTCVYFQKLVDSDRAFKTAISDKLATLEYSLEKSLDNATLLNYVTSLGEALDKFPMLKRTGPVENCRARFETLWRLRYLPKIDQAVIHKGCELYDVNTRPKILEDVASLQTGLHFRFYKFKPWGKLIVPFSATFSGLWATFHSVGPTFRISGIPWVEFSVLPFTWDAFGKYFGIDTAVYAINTPPNVSNAQHSITPKILMSLNNYTTVRRAIDSMADYVTGVRYLTYPYLIGVGIHWGFLVLWNYKTTWAAPRGDISVITLKSAQEYYERARGAVHKHVWKNRLWFGAKTLVSAGLLALVAVNVMKYSDFITNQTTLYALNYLKEVEALRESYTRGYLTYTSELGKDLFASNLNPLMKWDSCPTYFTPEAFRNYTPTFLAYHLLDPPIWQYANGTVNGTLRFAYLYKPCERIFNVLLRNNICSMDTLVNILHPTYAGVKATYLQPTPIFTYMGSLLPMLWPQLIITLHFIYLLLVAVW